MNEKIVTRVYGDGGIREKRPGRWECYFNLDGKQVFRAAGRSEQEALKALRRYQKKAAAGEYRRPDQERLTISDLLDGYESHLRTKGAKSPSHAGMVKRLRELFGLERALDPGIAVRVERWVAEELALENPPAPATLNRYLQSLRAAYRLAWKRDPVIRVPYLELLKEDNVRQGFFEEEEWEAVRAELDPDQGDFCHFGYLTGWRRGSVVGLRWSQIDRGARELRIGTSKNGEPNILPLVAELGELIDHRWVRREYLDASGNTCIADLVFHRRGLPIGDFRKAWTSACQRAGVHGKLPYHDFRRTAARNFIRTGTHQQVAKAILGHKTDSMFARYNITTTTDKEKAFTHLTKRKKVIELRRKQRDGSSRP